MKSAESGEGLIIFASTLDDMSKAFESACFSPRRERASFVTYYFARLRVPPRLSANRTVGEGRGRNSQTIEE